MEQIKNKIKNKRKLSPEVIKKKRIIALQNLEKARKMGKLGKRGKTKYTLLKENIEAELRDNYLGQVAPHLPAITKQQIIQAKTGDGKTAQYIINQAIGKPKERIEQDLSSEALKKIEQQDKQWAKKQDKE